MFWEICSMNTTDFARILAVTLAKAHYPDEHTIIDAAAALSVTVDPTNPHHAYVAGFPVNGSCACRAYGTLTNRCVHRFAKALAGKAPRLAAYQWYATYRDTAGVATQTPDGTAYVFQSDAHPAPVLS